MDVPVKLITCPRCSIPFWITEGKDKALRKCHNTFYCPDGHDQYYPQETKEESLQKEVNKLQQTIKNLTAKSVKRTTSRRKK